MYVKRDVQETLRPMWVTWGQQRWDGTVRVFEDYGTRNLPEIISLGDAIDFQLQLGTATKYERYREIWRLFQERVDASRRIAWRSPTEWSLSCSLFALEVRGTPSSEVFGQMYRDHGFVFRPFSTQGLSTVRISPNVYNTEDEIARFFEIAERM
jgi:selenocysteine lyase/cysteine desulfurase